MARNRIQPVLAGGDDAKTRRALLSAATEIFVKSGFRATTVRAICKRAGANVAAVNYHFGNKEGLYSAVLNESAALALKAYPPNLGLSPKATPEERLHAFIRSFLLRVYSEGAHSCHSRLMSRELVEPTPALDLLAKQTVAPMAAQLMGIIRTLAGPAASEADIRRCSLSVVSQVLFYHHGRPMIDRVFPGFRMDDAEIEALADHITTFSLAGIRQLKSRTQKR